MRRTKPAARVNTDGKSALRNRLIDQIMIRRQHQRRHLNQIRVHMQRRYATIRCLWNRHPRNFLRCQRHSVQCSSESCRNQQEHCSHSHRSITKSERHKSATTQYDRTHTTSEATPSRRTPHAPAQSPRHAGPPKSKPHKKPRPGCVPALSTHTPLLAESPDARSV